MQGGFYQREQGEQDGSGFRVYGGVAAFLEDWVSAGGLGGFDGAEEAGNFGGADATCGSGEWDAAG